MKFEAKHVISSTLHLLIYFRDRPPLLPGITVDINLFVLYFYCLSLSLECKLQGQGFSYFALYCILSMKYSTWNMKNIQ